MELQQELKALYNALCELLRHFWSCFPASSKLLEEKLVRMKTNLEKYQVAKLQPFAEKLAQHHYTVNVSMFKDIVMCIFVTSKWAFMVVN